VQIDEVKDQEGVNLVDELGSRVFSERLVSHIITIASGAIAQSLTWDVPSVTIPDSINRILGIMVFVDVTARVDFCSVSVRETPVSVASNSIPLWAWDSAVDVEYNLRSLQAGSTQNRITLAPRPALNGFQSMMLRTGIGRIMPLLDFNGVTNAFGAGTLNASARIYLARPDTIAPSAGEPSSHGLPIPGW